MQAISSIESICILKRYFSQMSFIKTRFPMEAGDPLAVPFSWYVTFFGYYFLFKNCF